jgi:hypothetical protein
MVMTNLYALLGATTAGLFQVLAQTPTCLGPVGEQLPTREVLQITEVAQDAGGEPWVVLGFPSMILGHSSVAVYLEPHTSTDRVRRGKVLRLVASDPPVVPARSPWRLESTHDYAHIVLSGRQPREVRSQWDIGRPFTTEGDIDDETLLSLVAFIRSNPGIPGVPEGAAPRQVDGQWPVSSIQRRDGMFVVTLQTGSATGHTITLERRERRWIILKFSMWIV